MDTLLNSLGLSDPLAVLMACAWLALLMGHAGVSKLRDRSFFEQHLAAYRVPDALLAPLSWALPALECLCVALLLSPWRAWGAGLCAVLLAAYALAMARQLQTGRRLDCGCGGEPLPVSWALVLRNMALLPVAAVAATDRAVRVRAAANPWPATGGCRRPSVAPHRRAARWPRPPRSCPGGGPWWCAPP